MTVEEVNQVVDELKAQGYDEEEILASFYAMFCDDKLTADQLEALVNTMGYELTDEFKNLSDEEKKKYGEDEGEGNVENKNEAAEGVDKKEVEDAKQFGEKGETPKPEEENKPQEEAPKPEEKPAPDDDEEAHAKKLFGLK